MKFGRLSEISLIWGWIWKKAGDRFPEYKSSYFNSVGGGHQKDMTASLPLSWTQANGGSPHLPCLCNVHFTCLPSSQKLVQGYRLETEIWCWDYLSWVCDGTQLKPLHRFWQATANIYSSCGYPRQLPKRVPLLIKPATEQPGVAYLFLWFLSCIPQVCLVSGYTQEVVKQQTSNSIKLKIKTKPS